VNRILSISTQKKTAINRTITRRQSRCFIARLLYFHPLTSRCGSMIYPAFCFLFCAILQFFRFKSRQSTSVLLVKSENSATEYVVPQYFSFWRYDQYNLLRTQTWLSLITRYWEWHGAQSEEKRTTFRARPGSHRQRSFTSAVPRKESEYRYALTRSFSK